VIEKFAAGVDSDAEEEEFPIVKLEELLGGMNLNDDKEQEDDWEDDDENEDADKAEEEEEGKE
jgi:hypothetical protein